MNIEDRIKEVIRDYVILDKARDDDGEFVIIAEKDDSESYEINKECLGVTKDGKLVWSYLSGCSCNGENKRQEINKTFKSFIVAEPQDMQTFFDNYACEPT